MKLKTVGLNGGKDKNNDFYTDAADPANPGRIGMKLSKMSLMEEE